MQGNAISDLMTTAEVAAYLRLKERKIYALVRARLIPCSRVTGKLLFPKPAIDLWIARNTAYDGPALRVPPPIAGGSHDPLLEWAIRESGSGLALLGGGSADGLHRVAKGEALTAGLHMIDDAGDYNVAFVRALGGMADAVLVEWAKRTQGLVLAAGNAHGIADLAGAAKKRLRVAQRQEGAGAQLLLRYMMRRDGIAGSDIALTNPPALNETELVEAVLDGKADCGIAIEAAARRFRLEFVPLQHERFDLVMHRRDYFEAPMQRLFAFARSSGFHVRAAELGGYDTGQSGRIVFNA